MILTRTHACKKLHVTGPVLSRYISNIGSIIADAFYLYLKVVNNEKGEAVGDVLTIIC